MDGLVQQCIQQQVLSAAKQLEDQIDEQIHDLDKLDGDDLERLREHKLQDIKQQALKRQQWLARGHGEYRELLGEKDFFAEVKGEERVICHFYRDSWPCKVMDKHLQQLANSHLETKFVKINAEKSPFLTDRLKIWMLPTLALIKQERTVDYVVGFKELGNRDDFATETLAARLQAASLLFSSTAMPGSTSSSRSIRQGGLMIHSQHDSADESSDFSD